MTASEAAFVSVSEWSTWVSGSMEHSVTRPDPSGPAGSSSRAIAAS
ncbi:hypothetical protein [Microbispora sp. H10670]|nr:hypothetical protein [Microbispora sp. H10670]